MNIKLALSYLLEKYTPSFLYPQAIRMWYKRRNGKDVDLSNPKTFNEKMQWIKLNYKDPEISRLSDKYLVREFVKERIGEEYLIPLLGVYDSFDEIDFDKLPDSFVMKANHGCGWNILVPDKAALDKNDARKKFKRWLRTDFSFCYGYQLHYSAIQPRIVVEKLISEKDRYLVDYKIFVFNGKISLIMVNTERNTGQRINLFDENWNPAPFTIGWQKKVPEPEPPENIEKMKELALKLAEGFFEVRVDFYNVDGKIYFGEMTFTSGSGTYKFDPPEWDRKFGDMMELPDKDQIR